MESGVHGSRVFAQICFVLGLTLFQITDAFADASGRSGRSGRTAGNDCTDCHTNAATLPTVTPAGPTSVMGGSTNRYSVTVSGGPGVEAGLDVAASGGTLAATMTGTKLLSGEIVQSTPTPMTGGSVTYSFDWTAPAAAGTYTLYIAGMTTNNNGSDTGDATRLATLAITVAAAANLPPAAVITGPANGTAGVAVSFSGARSTDADGTIASYAWNFGDNGTGTGASVTHSYTAAGTYTVTLTVTDNAGATNSKTASITIAAAGTPVPPTANAGGPYTGTAGMALRFDGSASVDPDGTIAAYAWDFGDGGTGTGARPTHTYAAAGSYTVKLTVTDNSNATGSATTTATISAAGGGQPSAGETLYDDHCASCHGAGGVGGPDGNVVGASAKDIMEAIDEYREMAFLADVLKPEDVDAIAAYLRRGKDGDGDEDDDDGDDEDDEDDDGDDDEDDDDEIRTLGGDEEEQSSSSGGGVKHSPSKNRNAQQNTTAASGALDWLTLLGAGVWFARRRRGA